jgi:hypothetical protein
MSDKLPRHVLVPHASVSDEALRPALATLRLPNLQALLQHLSAGTPDTAPEDSLSPPHERALAAAFGLPVADGLIPWGAWNAAQQGLPAQDPGWALLAPCHWQVGMNQVRQDHPDELRLTAEESAGFMEAMRPYFAEDGITLHTGPHPGAWLAHGAPLVGLPTASLDRVIGRNIGVWNLGDEAGRTLRRLQQEMQMLLYTLALNDAREARGQQAVNSFWISGTGDMPAGFQASAPPPSHTNALTQAALRQDAAGWQKAWLEWDARVGADLLAAARAGEPFTLTLCGEQSFQHWHRRPLGLVEKMRRKLQPVNVTAVLEAL